MTKRTRPPTFSRRTVSAAVSGWTKRRFIQPETAAEIVRLLKPGGRVRFVTDWKAYADWALEILNATPGLNWTAEAADDWRRAPVDHVVTRYEEKRLGDTPPIFLDFVRE